MIWFMRGSRTGKLNYPKKYEIVVASGEGRRLIQKDVRELSGVIEIFYILMGYGLKKCIHFSKVYGQSMWFKVCIFNEWKVLTNSNG